MYFFFIIILNLTYALILIIICVNCIFFYYYKKVQTPKKSIKSVNVGDKVKHKIFGQGMIVQKKEKNGDIEVVVSFENKGLKKLLLSVAPIEVID